jgi:hypothetical protein
MTRMDSSQLQDWPIRCFLPLVLCLVAGLAWASDPSARIGVTGQFGGGMAAMGDINGHIRDGNRFLSAPPLEWTELDEIHHGYNFTWDIRSRIKGPLSVSLGGGSFFARSTVDFDQVISVRATMPFYHVRAMYKLPFRPMPSMILSLGGGPIYCPKSQLRVKHEHRTADGGTDRTESATFEGKGWGAHAFLQSELVLTEKITLLTDLGYRRATFNQDSWTWGVSGKNLIYRDANGNNILDAYEFRPYSWLPNSFVDVVKDGDVPRSDSRQKPVLTPKGKTGQDFSGALLNIGLRFYLF